MIAPAVGLLVSATYGVDAEYEPDISCETFIQTLEQEHSCEIHEESLLKPAFLARIALNQHRATA